MKWNPYVFSWSLVEFSGVLFMEIKFLNIFTHLYILWVVELIRHSKTDNIGTRLIFHFIQSGESLIATFMMCLAWHHFCFFSVKCFRACTIWSFLISSIEGISQYFICWQHSAPKTDPWQNQCINVTYMVLSYSFWTNQRRHYCC